MYLLVRIMETHHEVLLSASKESELTDMLKEELQDGHRSYIKYVGDTHGTLH